MNELKLYNKETSMNARREYVSPACRIRETEMIYMYLQTISDWGGNHEEID